MFSLFKKKGTGPKITDVVFVSKDAKCKALAQMAGQDSGVSFVAWFEESREQLQQFFDRHSVQQQVHIYRELHGAANTKLIFIEHYPLAEKEKNLYESLQLTAATVYSSLDEALFTMFGGDRISSMLTQMGLDENEPISHSMITSAIHNAQEKLSKKITIDQSARSMEEWVRKNTGTASA